MISLRVPGSFTTDGSGNGHDNRIIATGNWAAVYASCQCNGSGQWVAGAQGDADFFQQGANVVLGPFILRPGDHVQVAVVGASPNAQASIVYHGWQSDQADGSDLAQVAATPVTAGSISGSAALSLSGNVPVVNATGTQLATNQPQKLLASKLNVAANAQFTQTLTLDSGCHVIGIGVAPHAGGTGATLNQLSTHNLGFPLSFFVQGIAVPLPQGFWLFPVSAVIDPSNQIDIVLTAGSNVTDFYFVEILDVESVGIGSITPGINGGSGSLHPAMAPNQPSASVDFTLGASATVTVVSAPPQAWEQLYIHDIRYLFDIVAATTGIWKASAGQNLIVDQWNADVIANSASSSGGDRWWPCRGFPLGAGNSLQLVNQTGTAGPHIRGMVTFSIGI